MEDWKSVSISLKDLDDLKKLYADAVESGVDSFKFKGETLVTGFAKYWIEYIKTQFNSVSLTQCPVCGRLYEPLLKVPEGDDRLIQNIFPDSEPWEREQLLTGICSQECWEEGMGRE